MTPDLQSALARLRASGLCEARQAAFRKEARLYDKADADPSALVDRIDAAIAACAGGRMEGYSDEQSSHGQFRPSAPGGFLMAVTLEIGPNGSTVMVEPVLRKGLTRRVFRYMADGSLEWAAYDDWRSQHERARFFGFASRELPASMTS